MASADVTITIKDVPEVQELIEASAALDELLKRSYDPSSMSPPYQRFRAALEPFKQATP